MVPRFFLLDALLAPAWTGAIRAQDADPARWNTAPADWSASRSQPLVRFVARKE